MMMTKSHRKGDLMKKENILNALQFIKDNGFCTQQNRPHFLDSLDVIEVALVQLFEEREAKHEVKKEAKKTE